MKKYFCLLFVFCSLSLFSHPHMHFSSAVEFVFAGNKLKGAYVEWTFDRYFSADIISGYDLNKDGVFNAKETQDVWENAFSYTSNYYYFCFIREENRRSSPTDVSSFKVRQKDGIVSYNFYIDLSQFTSRELFFSIYDYTFFCDITYKEKNGVLFRYNSSTLRPTFKIIENKNYPVYYNPV